MSESNMFEMHEESQARPNKGQSFEDFASEFGLTRGDRSDGIRVEIPIGTAKQVYYSFAPTLESVQHTAFDSIHDRPKSPITESWQKEEEEKIKELAVLLDAQVGEMNGDISLKKFVGQIELIDYEAEKRAIDQTAEYIFEEVRNGNKKVFIYLGNTLEQDIIVQKILTAVDLYIETRLDLDDEEHRKKMGRAAAVESLQDRDRYLDAEDLEISHKDILATKDAIRARIKFSSDAGLIALRAYEQTHQPDYIVGDDARKGIDPVQGVRILLPAFSLNNIGTLRVQATHVFDSLLDAGFNAEESASMFEVSAVIGNETGMFFDKRILEARNPGRVIGGLAVPIQSRVYFKSESNVYYSTEFEPSDKARHLCSAQIKFLKARGQEFPMPVIADVDLIRRELSEKYPDRLEGIRSASLPIGRGPASRHKIASKYRLNLGTVTI